MKRRSLALIVAICICLPGFCALAEEPQPMEAALPWLEKNPDTIGWLKVGKIIDTPVTQRDNEFYLTHNYKGEKSSGGMVFVDEDCCIMPQDTHMVLYGHNMRSGAVFGELDRFRELSYLKKNAIVTFDTIYEEGQYVVIAAYDMSAETEDPYFMEMLRFNFATDEDFYDLVNDAQRRSFFVIPIDVLPSDHLISMITCSYTLFDGRMILMLRKIRPDEDPQEISERIQSTVMNENIYVPEELLEEGDAGEGIEEEDAEG